MTTTLVVPEGTTVRGTVGSNIRLCREVIKTADWVLDLGPEGGDKGGEVVAEGTPEQIIKEPRSYTARYLAPLLQAKREAVTIA